MQTYLSGGAITIAIPLHDESGVCYVASAVEYRIVDQADNELVARGSLGTFNSGDAQAVISIDGGINTLAAGMIREMRSVELFLTTAVGTVRLTREYIVEAAAPLELGINSFQSYNAAVLVAFEIPNLPAWNDATRHQRSIAMISAWRNIGRLYLRYFAEANDQSRIIYPYTDSGNVTILTADQFNALPERMRQAIYRAQVIEADYILGSNEMDEIRGSGVMSSTIGESTQILRPSKPFEGAVCKRAMKELGRYIVSVKRIGRA